MTRHAWGSTELDDSDREYSDPDPRRHDVPQAKADADWRGTLAALDGVAGDSIYARMELEDAAWWDDWEEPDDA